MSEKKRPLRLFFLDEVNIWRQEKGNKITDKLLAKLVNYRNVHFREIETTVWEVFLDQIFLRVEQEKTSPAEFIVMLFSKENASEFMLALEGINHNNHVVQSAPE